MPIGNRAPVCALSTSPAYPLDWEPSFPSARNWVHNLCCGTLCHAVRCVVLWDTLSESEAD